MKDEGSAKSEPVARAPARRRWEEEILFPLFEKKTGMQFGPTYVMRNEHKEIAAHLESIHKKVQKADPSSDREEQKLLEVLGAHNQKEEAILYPQPAVRL